MQLKRCTRCGDTKSVDEFRRKSVSPDGYTSWCRKCFAIYDRERYANGDNVRVRRNDQARLKRNQDFIKDYLQTHPCVDCGDDDWWNLDFDHVDQSTKTKDVCLMIRENGMSALLDEVDKCVVRCTKCHRRRTIEQLGWWRTIS